MIDHNVLPLLVRMMAQETFDIKKEAAWAISNATSSGENTQVAYLVQVGCIPPLCALLDCGDSRIFMVVLEALENILKVGNAQVEMCGSGIDQNPFCDLIEECGGVDALENLQVLDKTEIVDKAIQLIRVYFGEAEEENTLGPSHDGMAFGFGANANVPSTFDFGRP